MKRWITPVIGLVLMLPIGLFSAGRSVPVLAATGSILADIVPSGTTGNGRGLTFDGKNLWYTLVNDPNIYKVSTTGAAVGSITVAGNAANGGPLGWDGSALWTANSPVCTVSPCSPTTKILRVDPASGAILSSCDFVAANPADPGVVTPGTGISRSVDGGDWSTTAKAMWLSSEGSTNAGNWVVELNSTTCKVITEFVAPPKGADGTSGLAFMADPVNGDKLWHAHPNRPADIIQTDTAGITTILPFLVPYSTEDLAFDPVTFAPKCAVWGNQATTGSNHLTAYEVPCPVPSCVENDGNGAIMDQNSRQHAADKRDVTFNSDMDDLIPCEEQDAEESAEAVDQDRLQVDAHDNRDGSDFQSTRVDSTTFSQQGKAVTIKGSGIHGGKVVSFAVVEVDNGTSRPGSFSLQCSDGYNVAGSLVDGVINLN